MRSSAKVGNVGHGQVSMKRQILDCENSKPTQNYSKETIPHLTNIFDIICFPPQVPSESDSESDPGLSSR